MEALASSASRVLTPLAPSTGSVCSLSARRSCTLRAAAAPGSDAVAGNSGSSAGSSGASSSSSSKKKDGEWKTRLTAPSSSREDAFARRAGAQAVQAPVEALNIAEDVTQVCTSRAEPVIGDL